MTLERIEYIFGDVGVGECHVALKDKDFVALGTVPDSRFDRRRALPAN
jgi:hypothetical protein